jgi:hypothetical protein
VGRKGTRRLRPAGERVMPRTLDRAPADHTPGRTWSFVAAARAGCLIANLIAGAFPQSLIAADRCTGAGMAIRGDQ